MAKVPVKQRFLYEGNGQLPVCNHNTGECTIVDYKNRDGTYNEKAQEEADHAFGIPSGSHEHYSLRLVALLDHLQDHFQADHYETISSYRDFLHNLVLRASGRPAVQTSLHLDGMATDGFFPGVDARTVWNYLRELRNGGAGYYYQDPVFGPRSLQIPNNIQKTTKAVQSTSRQEIIFICSPEPIVIFIARESRLLSN
ncbi:MAG: DUF882 domain-containing protein [Deltaproteobacteria bacterium]|nr:DUF882 domain-containing protein [Deltaproteobacteria bacterium]